MLERTRWSFQKNAEDEGLQLDIPQMVWDRLPLDRRLRRAFGELSRNNRAAISIVPHEDRRRIVVNEKKIGAMNAASKVNALHRVTYVLRGLTSTLYEYEENSAFPVCDGLIRPDLNIMSPGQYARLTPSFEVAWPKLGQTQTDTVVSGAMLRTAKNLGYRDGTPGGGIDTLFNRALYGAILTVDDTKNISIQPNPEFYNPNEPIVRLSGEVETYEQQLICMVGTVALAHADELV